jgi:hypothetical protein
MGCETRRSGARRAAMKRVLSVLLLCVLGAATRAHAGAPGEVAVGQALREATMRGLNGPPRRLS